MKNRMFYLEADNITDHDFDLIHRYIRKVLQVYNKNLTIRSIPIEDFDLLETLIKKLVVD
jgi:hypothetical protein